MPAGRVLTFRAADEACSLCGACRSAHRNAQGIWIGCGAGTAGEIRARLRQTLAKCSGVRVVRPFGIDLKGTENL